MTTRPDWDEDPFADELMEDDDVADLMDYLEYDSWPYIEADHIWWVRLLAEDDLKHYLGDSYNKIFAEYVYLVDEISSRVTRPFWVSLEDKLDYEQSLEEQQ